ncbi:transmembrane protein 115 [Orussus abietinus]|uniref:transmembrane protein 115 n=1 Tax=Orussus abietinus TaxID=222816 RepID=UPI000626D6BF|nr:transmembrane protein 115 [Orussus abietinus]XP_023288810.1 transmembrane protein 115 [Orussus abietinus]
MTAIKGLGRNIPYLRQQFAAFLGNMSNSVKFICIVVLISYCLSFSEDAVKALSVTPGYLLPPAFWIWTAFTFCFLEMHFWEVCVDIITMGLCSKLIEPLWGALEMMTFFAIVNVGVAVQSALFYLFLYMCTSDTDLLFDVHIHGLAGYIAGVTVAVKQIMPDHILIKTPMGKITNRNIPLIIWMVGLSLWLLGLLEGTYPTMFLSGLLVSWIYLRFYQRHSNGTRGDMADNFTFASFFPNVLQPPIAVVSNTIHGFFVRMGICKKVVRRFDMSNAPPGLVINLPGIDPHDSERRRQIALKALSERLSKDHTKSWQQDRSKKHSPVPPAVSIPIPESTAPKPLASPLIPQINVNIHSHPSTSAT